MILFFGAPGVGKGTQAKIVSKNLHIPHISTGDILRTAIRKKRKRSCLLFSLDIMTPPVLTG